MEPDGIFLDLYGTLTTGDREAVERTCARIVAETSLPLTAAELSIVWGERFLTALEACSGDAFLTLAELEARTLVETLASYGRSADPTPYVGMLVEYWRNPPLQPEVREFFRFFRYPICIVSNADRADAEAALTVHGLRVDALVTSEDTRSYKPDPYIFETALQRTGWRRERVMHVGDSLHSDVAGARAAGLCAGWLNRAQRIHDIGTATPDHEFRDLLDLAARWPSAEGPGRLRG